MSEQKSRQVEGDKKKLVEQMRISGFKCDINPVSGEVEVYSCRLINGRVVRLFIEEVDEWAEIRHVAAEVGK